jgi:FlaA1/EpsC-like NDP-sugar epimerase
LNAAERKTHNLSASGYWLEAVVFALEGFGVVRVMCVRELPHPRCIGSPIVESVRSVVTFFRSQAAKLSAAQHALRNAGRAAGQAPREAATRSAADLAALLGRPAVNLDTPELQRFLAGKRVLVTGAGGSIGSEICRQAMRFCPRQLLLLERAENALFEIDRELRQNWGGAEIIPYIGDVCDLPRVEQVFRSWQPQVVFHCAAHKHVPLMEYNPCEAIKNNVFGTKAVADAAAAHRAQAFVLVSTDKAVNPTSVMGATKRFAELYVQSLSRPLSFVPGPLRETSEGSLGLTKDNGPRTTDPGAARLTRFVAVRFGNVLGSSGSVVPIFQRQIESGGPVTVTHPKMKRYFMTIPEASQLVMQAGAIGKGGEVFILDMGEPVLILELARELILRNGLVPGEDIEIRFSGVRPGEKLYEELARDDEQTRPTGHPKIRVWQLPAADPARVAEGLSDLAAAARGSAADAVAALARWVPEYRRDASADSTAGPPQADSTRASSGPAPRLRLVTSEAPAKSSAGVEAA